MIYKSLYFIVFLSCSLFINAETPAPNIIIFLSDDMGMGDSSAYQQFTKNSDAEQIYTPAMERLAERGIRFTDGHSAAAVCHPSRVGLMRGGRPVDYDLPLGPTMPSMLQRAGYRTYGIGKWHIRFQAGADYHGDSPIKECALDYGFNHYTGTEHNTGHSPAFHIDRAYQIYNEKTGKLSPNPSKAAPGYEKPGGTFVQVQTQLWMHTFRDYLSSHSAGGEFSDKPFFLYYASHANHGEFKPADEVDGIKIIGGSKTVDKRPLLSNRDGLLKIREEMVWENDVALSRIMDWLDKTEDPRNPGHKMAENTLLIFSSDNGANSSHGSEENYEKKISNREKKKKADGKTLNNSLKKGKKGKSKKAKSGSKPGENTPPNGLLRGNKADIYEGGHRVPLIMAWPKVIPANKWSSAQICLSDLFATFAAITGQKLRSNEAPDSFNILPSLKAPEKKTERPVGLYIVDKRKSELNSLRLGDFKIHWKMRKGNNVEFTELFNLGKDLGETNDLIKNPEFSQILQKMKTEALKLIELGHTREEFHKSEK